MPAPQFVHAMITVPATVDFSTTVFPDYVSWCNGQLERGGTTGYLHWQIYAEFNRKVTRTRILEWVPTAHIERRRGNQEDAVKYTSKEDTYVSDRFEYGQLVASNQGHRSDLDHAIAAVKAGGLRRAAEEAPREFVKYHRGLEALALALKDMPRDEGFVPRPWQRRVLDILSQPASDRTIHWVVDTIGNKGKSRLARHLLCEHKAIILSGRIMDMAYTYNEQPIVVFDIARTQQEYLNHLITFSEHLKDGVVNSTKYVPCVKAFKPPHVIFFSNTLPPDGAWSADRVHLINLDGPQA